MDRSETNESPLDFSWESPLVNEIIPTLALPHVCFPFFFFEFLFEMLEAVDTACLEGQSVCDLCVLHGLRKCVTLFNSSKKVGERWLTSSKISNDVDGKPCSRWPRGNRSHVECFQWSSCVKERSWVMIQMKDPLRIILHFIAFCIAFYCQLDLQWENYTMLVFCFIMLLFLIFQNIRNFILLYVMAENTSFLEVFKYLSRKRKIWSKIGVVSVFPYFDTPVGERSPLTTTKWQKTTLIN